MQQGILDDVVQIPVVARLRHVGGSGDLVTGILLHGQFARCLGVLVQLVHVPVLAFGRAAAIHQTRTWRELDLRVFEQCGLLEGTLDLQRDQQRVVGVAQLVEHHAHAIGREHQFPV